MSWQATHGHRQEKMLYDDNKDCDDALATKYFDKLHWLIVYWKYPCNTF